MAKIHTTAELRQLRRGKVPFYSVDYLPYLDAIDPETGESFGNEHGFHDDLYTEYSEARRRYDVLEGAADVVEVVELYKVTPDKRGGWGRSLLAERKDNPRRNNPGPTTSATELARRLKF